MVSAFRSWLEGECSVAEIVAANGAPVGAGDVVLRMERT